MMSFKTPLHIRDITNSAYITYAIHNNAAKQTFYIPDARCDREMSVRKCVKEPVNREWGGGVVRYDSCQLS